MSKKTKSTPEYIAKCQNWCRVAMFLDRHVKPALVRILHNEVNDPNINGLPSDPKMLFEYLNEKDRKRIIKESRNIGKEQRNLLLPQKGEVSSKSLDITLLRFLINKFIYSGNLMKPHYYDHSIAAAVYRAADMRNTVCHYRDISAMGVVDFKDIWRDIQEILDDLKYPKDEDTKKAISDLEKAPFDPEKMEKFQENMAKDFEEILLKYKEKCKDKETGIFIDRKYKHKNTKQVKTEYETWLEQVETNKETLLEAAEIDYKRLLEVDEKISLEQVKTNIKTSLELVKTNIKTFFEQEKTYDVNWLKLIEIYIKIWLEQVETGIVTRWLEQLETNNETWLEQEKTKIKTFLEQVETNIKTSLKQEKTEIRTSLELEKTIKGTSLEQVKKDYETWLEQIETDIETWLEQEITNKETLFEQVDTNIKTWLEQVKTIIETWLEQVETLIKNWLEISERHIKTWLEQVKTDNETWLEQVKTDNEIWLEQEKTETNIETLLEDYDSVMVTAEAGLGKTFSARQMRDLWAADKILLNKKMLYIDSKKVNKKLYKPSNAAPICVSELGDALKDKSDKYLESFGCVKKHIRDLLVIVDGADELSIGENIDLEFLKKLEKKIDVNSEISAMETIIGIYFGLLFPGAKIVVFGRHHEIDRLIRIHDQRQRSNLFNKQKRVVLELQRLEQDGVKELISRVVCKKASCDCQKCTSTHTLVKDVELLTIPSNLMAVIRVNLNNNLMVRIFGDPHNFSRITRTIIFIITIFDKLKNHAQIDKQEDVEISFKRLLNTEKTLKFPEFIQNIAKMCFFSLRERNVNIEVKKSDENDGVYFTFETIVHGNQISVKVERDIVEQLDFFYIYDEDYNVRLEPRHLTNMEFLASCFIYNCPKYLGYLDDLEIDRKLIIHSFIAGLLSNDNLTIDFRSKVLKDTSDLDLELYLQLLFEVIDFHIMSQCSNWHGLKENGDLFPSFDLLHRINEEVDVFDDISKRLEEVQTLVCSNLLDLEWYTMEKFRHTFLTNSKVRYNIKDFVSNFKQYQILVKGAIRIVTYEEFDLLLQMVDDDNIKFKIQLLALDFSMPKITPKTKYLKCRFLHIGSDCDSHTIDLLLEAISPYTATALSIQCEKLVFQDITKLSSKQTELFFLLGLNNVVGSIRLDSRFFTDGKTAILMNFEHQYLNKLITIELKELHFTHIFTVPKFGKRTISLREINGINDKNLVEFKAHISPGHTYNFANYKIVNQASFVRKRNCSQNCEQSMYLSIFDVDFNQVSSKVFAEVFSLIPSLEFTDNVSFIPSSHWSALSEIGDSKINEFRIWWAQAINFKLFLKIKTKITQFIFPKREDLKKLLDLFVNDPDIQLDEDEEIKVFIVKKDDYDLDYYKEKTLFGGKPIKEYKINYISDNALLANEPETFREGSRDSLFCCEISDRKNIKIGVGYNRVFLKFPRTQLFLNP